MNTVFPVELECFSENGRESSGLLQAFTRDLSAGGMCLELKSFGKDGEKLLSLPGARLELTINPTFSTRPIRASAKIVWLKREAETLPARYLIGIAYSGIEANDRKRLIGYAKHLMWVPRFVGLVGVVMTLALLFLLFRSQSLIQENKKLVNDLLEATEVKSRVISNMDELQKRRSALEADLKKAQGKIKTLEGSMTSATNNTAAQQTTFQIEMAKMLAEQKKLEQELERLQKGKERLRTAYEALEQQTKPAATTVLYQMVGWLESHQNLKTGLVASFEGDNSIEDWAFTYDQSLAAQVFMLFGQDKRAEDILEFYASRATRSGGAFYNAYDTASGSPMESMIHVGPNVWLGIAAMQHEHRKKNGRFLPLAKQLGEWAISQQDAEGGLKGGPALTWYSIEHNLDAYALFSMLFENTGQMKYKVARSQVLHWLKKYAYSVKEKRINRGKGDSTIATDTFSWSIAAVGPEMLGRMGFDPEEIMVFAEDHCRVEAEYKQPSGKNVKVTGFDFSKAENVGRGGVVSTEWTAQAIVTYRILWEYFESIGESDKAAFYINKANFYLNELQKLIITSPSRTGQGRGCLPYATMDNVDTGHGWRTPNGRRTGSVSGTAYGIFAWTGYNPFRFNNDVKKNSDEGD